MRSLLLSIVIVSYSTISFSQKIFWSDVTQGDREEATEIAEVFFEVLDKHDYDSIKSFLLPGDLDIGGKYMLSSEEWVSMVKKLTKSKSYGNVKCYNYLFDDFLDSFYENDIIKKSYKVFDNHSIIVHAINEEGGAREDALIVMRMNKEKEWKIYSLNLVGIPVEIEGEKKIDLNQFRKEELMGANISFYLPNNYSTAEIEQNQINYSLVGETERDAVFQIMVDNNNAKIHFYTYKFVEHMNMQYDLSGLVVTYLPIGIKFEYEVIDPYGTKNKGITIGISESDRNIVFQYYSFLDIYDKNKEDVEYTINSLEFINRSGND